MPIYFRDILVDRILHWFAPRLLKLGRCKFVSMKHVLSFRDVSFFYRCTKNLKDGLFIFNLLKWRNLVKRNFFAINLLGNEAERGLKVKDKLVGELE